MTLKHNLKNRPHLNDYPQSASKARLEEYVNELVEWIEDFKEELHQLKQELNRKNIVYDDEESKIYDKAQNDLINEILGENNK